MDYMKLRNCRHADPLKVRQVWDALSASKGQRVVVPTDKLVKLLRKTLSLKDDQIRLLLDEIEGDGLVEKVASPFSKGPPAGYRFPDFSRPCSREKHDWYCYQCHKPGEVLRCSDCFRVYHIDCAQEASKLSSPCGKSLRSPALHDGLFDEFTCAVCESRPKCEFSRKQIRKLLEFATHQLRKQPIWKSFLQIGYSNEINKNEYLVYKYIDLTVLQRKIKDGRYAALEGFSMDLQLLVHDVCILHGPYSSQADEVRFLLRSVNAELQEIQLCTDCYINAKTRLSDWISKPCKPPHELIWACNRTPIGAGFFNDAVISQYYWPAKVLLERDDAYEVRFFGGTHERALVMKSNTRPFHIPADDVGVLRRSNSAGALPGGGFERAWNEVSKLQSNIDSGYYTHSSGESDLPPSDDNYSDEIYLGPRRGSRSVRADSPRSSSVSTNTKKVKRRRHTSSSSQQTTTSTTPTNDAPSPPLPKSLDRFPHARSTSRTYKIESNERRKISPKLPMPSVQPGTPGAAAISALAETKAAIAAAVGNTHRTNTTDLFMLTSKHDSATFHKEFQSATRRTSVRSFRGRRGPGRPPKTPNQDRKVIRRTSISPLSDSHSRRSLSSLSSIADSDLENGAASSETVDSGDKWNPKQIRTSWKSKSDSRGRLKGRPYQTKNGPSLGIPHRTTGHKQNSKMVENEWSELTGRHSKPIASPRGRPRLHTLQSSLPLDRKHSAATPTKTSSIGRFASPGKKMRASKRHISENIRTLHDDDDELTDRCCSPSLSVESPNKGVRGSRGHWVMHNHSPISPLSPNRKKISPVVVKSPTVKSSPSKRVNGATPKRRFSTSSNGTSYSSPSTSDAESEGEFADRHRSSLTKTNEDERKFRSPTRGSSKELKLTGTSSTMLRRPPFAPPLGGSSSLTGTGLHSDRTSSASVTHLFSSMGSNPHGNFDNLGQGSFFPASSATPSGTLSSGHSASSTAGAVGANNSGTTNPLSLPGLPAGMSALPRSHLPPNKRAAAAATAAAALNCTEDVLRHTLNQQPSPRDPDLFSLPPVRKVAHKGAQTATFICPNCKERDSQRLAELSEHKQQLRELEERLKSQFKEEMASAVQTALDDAQSTMRETIEREQKLTLEAAEARFAEVLVQTKRRQWCRNCLSEAIYHCCWNTSYCSIPCQQEHWQNEHKRQCRRKR